MNQTVSRAGKVIALMGLLALASCADMDEEQQKMLSGGAIGAVVGTVGIAITGGCIPCGTAIGGAVGVAAGYLIDQIDKNTKSSPSSSSSSSSSGNGYYSSNPPPPNVN
jgi:hypothetical protein